MYTTMCIYVYIDLYLCIYTEALAPTRTPQPTSAERPTTTTATATEPTLAERPTTTTATATEPTSAERPTTTTATATAALAERPTTTTPATTTEPTSAERPTTTTPATTTAASAKGPFVCGVGDVEGWSDRKVADGMGVPDPDPKH